MAIKQDEHLACGAASPRSHFGYCPDDNTVYYSSDFAREACDSLPALAVDDSTGNVTLTFHQPADFAIGEPFSVAWGLAVRHQLFAQKLSPSDLDEAVSGLLDQAGRTAAFGSRDSTGLDRIDAFVNGYNEPLSSC